MKLYHEITIIENSDIDRHFIWKKLYQQVHLALASIQNDHAVVPVGVSFPEYKYTNTGEQVNRDIGTKLRLFASNEETLSKLNIKKFLLKLQDYVHIPSIRNVPNKLIGHAIYTRQQSDKNIETLARRKAKRENITEQEALQRLGNYKNKPYKLPYITINSLSSKQSFPLFIVKNEAQEARNIGFNAYGLSAISTVPEF